MICVLGCKFIITLGHAERRQSINVVMHFIMFGNRGSLPFLLFHRMILYSSTIVDFRYIFINIKPV